MNRWLLILLLSPGWAWWSASWNYSMKITADGNASLVDGYFTLNTRTLIAAGKLRPDCADIRVIRGSTTTDYYVVGCNRTDTVVLFDAPYTGDAYYLYYGNPAASSEASTGFLEFYDGFSYSAGSDGSPTWTVRSGSFVVNYTNASMRYLLNSTSESAATSFTPSGNFSLLAEIHDGGGKPGLLYGYASAGNFSAYLNGSQIWANENGTYSQLGSFTPSYFTLLKVDVLGSRAKIYADGAYVGEVNASGGAVGVYARPGTAAASFDEFMVFKTGGIGWTLGGEESRPALVVEFLGSESANMRTLVAYLDDDEHTVKLSLEPSSQDLLASSGKAELSWATLRFNSTGYSINGEFVQIDADSFNYTNGAYRIDLEYVKTTKNYKRWHIVQAFKNFKALKHIVFITANQTGNYSAGVLPWSGCTSYHSISGSKSCSSSMHASAGRFSVGNYEICGLHWGESSPLRIYDNLSVSAKGYGKKIFWQSYDGCEKFTQEVEGYCGTDYSNCTAGSVVPAQVLFYVADRPGALGRIELPSGLNCSINGNPVSELIDTSIINKGLNELKCYGTSNLTRFKLYLSEPYEAARFFGERPGKYLVRFPGPATLGKIKGICGVPVVDKILPYTCSNGNLFIKGSFKSGIQKLYVFATDRSWKHSTARGGQSLAAEVVEEPILPPLAGAREMGPPINPPTHDVISSRRVIYANETVVELVMSAWKAI